MSIFMIYERAFHPDTNFGSGGFWFKGDNRGFSFQTGVTSRVWSRVKIDTENATAVYAPHSSDFFLKSDLSKAPLFLGGRTETYESKATRPSGTARSTGGEHVKDSIQNISVSIHTWGVNHAFPTEYISNTLTKIVVPDLDLQVKMSLLIDRHKKEMTITSNLLGDGFPNSEIFIIDSANTPLMINTHHRFGSAASQLIGKHGHLLGSTVLTIGIDESDNFIGPITVQRCVDFMPWDRNILAITQKKEFSLYEWNGIHVSRNPSEGIFGIDTDSSSPLPPGLDHQWPHSSKNPKWDIWSEPTIDELPQWNQ